MVRPVVAVLLALLGLAASQEPVQEPIQEPVQESSDENVVYVAERFVRESVHTNNWAVIASTSLFWFNYRHMANVLSIYRTVRRLGIPDDQIIVMLPDEIACNPRNPYVGSVFNDHEHSIDIYGEEIEVDYRGNEVTVENFIRLLTDRWDDDVPRSKRLLSDDQSNVLVYLTGHGGDDFLKFQDADDISSTDLADAFNEMFEKKRYNELLFMIDTCEANTMYSKIRSPNIIAVGSSELHESSYANSTDDQMGVSLIDRFTSHNLQFLEQVDKNSRLTLSDLFSSYDPEIIYSHPGIMVTTFPDDLDDVRITDFFGNIQSICSEPLDILLEVYPEEVKYANSSLIGEQQWFGIEKFAKPETVSTDYADWDMALPPIDNRLVSVFAVAVVAFLLVAVQK